MALLNFPENPITGQIHVIGTTTWQWNGYAWIKFNTVVQGPTVTTVTNTITVTTGTNSTSTTTGGLVVNGGAGIGGDVYIGGDVRIQSQTSATSTTTGALTVEGGVGIRGEVWVGGRIHSESLRISESIFDSTNSTTTNGTSVVIDTYSINEYIGAKYLIQVDENDGQNYQISEMLLIVAGTTPYKTEYAPVSSNGELGIFQPIVAGSTLTLYMHPNTTTNLTINVLRQGLVK